VPAPVPAAPGIPTKRAIYWRSVIGVGSLVWLLIAGLIAGPYIRQLSPRPEIHPFHFLAASLATWSNSVRTAQTAEPVAAPTTTLPVAMNDKPAAEVVKKPSPVKPAQEVKETSQPQPPKEKAPANPPPVPPDDPKAQAPSLPATEFTHSDEPASCQNYGTQVAFVSNPAEAAQRALKEHKLLFLLHLSGNFEDAAFT
jgi:hypothetical protein